MDQQWSNGCKQVRHEAGMAIFNCLDDDLKTGDARFKKFSELIGWVGNGNTRQYDPLAPILYKDDDGIPEKERIFLNPILFKVWYIDFS